MSRGAHPPIRGVWFLVLLPLLLLSCGPTERMRPHIILVTLDTTRADRLGCYGHELALTPVLDSLAAAGIVFDQAVTSVPVTLPAHSTILTGVYPFRHGVRDNGIFVLPDEFRTVAEILREDGYQTGAFISAYVLDKNFGTAQGFTTYNDQFHSERPALLPSRKAIRWVDRLDGARPFFMWIHYYDPHLPRTPPEPYRSMRELDPYDQEVAAMDAGLGWLIAELKDRDLLSRTDILLVGDHGEGLGDHGEPEHGLFLYDATLRVPLILCPHDNREAGRRWDGLVTIEDVAPTLLEMAGAHVPRDVDGVDLISLVRGKRRRPAHAAYGETYFPQYNFYHSHIFSMRTSRWKYVSAPRPELYHLGRDAEELRNVIAAFPDTARVLQDRLLELRGAAEELAAQAPQTLAPAELERLRSLGYLGGGGLAMEMETSGEFSLPDPKEMASYAEIFARGLNAMNAGRHEEGVACLREVLERNPENVITRLNLGKLYLTLRRPAEAVEQFEHAVNLSQSATSRLLLARAYKEVGRYAEAIEILRQLEEHPVQGEAAVHDIARVQLMMDRLDEARLTFRQLADRTGGAEYYLQQAARVGAYIAAREALALDPEGEEARLRAARTALDLTLLGRAQRFLDFEGSTRRREAERRQLSGSVAGAAGDYEAALAEYEHALPFFRGDPYFRGQIAALYLEAGRPREALELMDGLLREGHVGPILYYNFACAHAQLGAVDEALQWLTRAIRGGYDNLENLQTDPDLTSVRQDPRFPGLIELVGEDLP